VDAVTSGTWGPGPYDSDAGHTYLTDLQYGLLGDDQPAPTVLLAMPATTRELAQQQYALAALIAVATGADTALHVPAAVTHLAADSDQEWAGLLSAARDALNELLSDPYALIWQGWDDGALLVKRRVRVLRALLHRACES
jgi:hypothetical protein